MVRVTVCSKESGMCESYDMEGTDTVLDVKRMVSADAAAVYLTFQGKPIADEVALSELGEDIVLCMEETIEFSPIECSDSIPIAGADTEYAAIGAFGGDIPIENTKPEDKPGHAHSADPETVTEEGADDTPAFQDHFSLNGSTYRITSRTPRWTLRYIVDRIEEGVTPMFIIQCLFLFYIIHTRNIFILALIVSIRILRLLSKCIFRNRLDLYFSGVKQPFMFIASLLFIDHPNFFTALPESAAQPGQAPVVE
ncbi:hypothetical protein PAPHI01_1320 [Pancytospora philotis]|nr:hypothetical protein PAPHI01_1320 [Pancytospora philotis]